jgi:hypothetical protein
MSVSTYHQGKGRNGVATRQTKKKNRSVRCNRLYKTNQSLNIYLKPADAIQLAGYLLEKAQEILDGNLNDKAVQLYNAGKNTETLAVAVENAVGEKSGHS